MSSSVLPHMLLLLSSLLFFFNDTATTEIYTLSLHDALPIYRPVALSGSGSYHRGPGSGHRGSTTIEHRRRRSEEHTSELQSLTNLVCRLLLEKKKKKNKEQKENEQECNKTLSWNGDEVWVRR